MYVCVIQANALCDYVGCSCASMSDRLCCVLIFHFWCSHPYFSILLCVYVFIKWIDIAHFITCSLFVRFSFIVVVVVSIPSHFNGFFRASILVSNHSFNQHGKKYHKRVIMKHVYIKQKEKLIVSVSRCVCMSVSAALTRTHAHKLCKSIKV